MNTLISLMTATGLFWGIWNGGIDSVTDMMNTTTVATLKSDMMHMSKEIMTARLNDGDMRFFKADAFAMADPENNRIDADIRANRFILTGYAYDSDLDEEVCVYKLDSKTMEMQSC
jgi:hypothetical protein